jgi:DNA-damage-inducible protein D
MEKNEVSEKIVPLKSSRNTTPIVFQGKGIRRSWFKNEWHYSLVDIVGILTESVNPTDYLKKIRRRDVELGIYLGTNCPQVDMAGETGKKRKTLAGNTKDVLRLIQSIPSKRAEPFKVWLAQVGKERIDEIENPELAMQRMKEIYEKKGYPKEWIDKRMRGIAVRKSLTDEWNSRGAQTDLEYAILTNEIMKGTFDKTVEGYKQFKNLNHENLRDHMNDIELILTMLGEATTTKLHQDRNSIGFHSLESDAKDGGAVAGRTRKDIEDQTKKKVVSSENFLRQTGKPRKIEGKPRRSIRH